MPKYRNVQTKIWNDKDFMGLSKDGKFLFIYLITNNHINNSGVFELPLKTISSETGLPVPTIDQILTNHSIKNVFYDAENEMIFIKNIRKYNKAGNPIQVQKGIISEFQENSKTFLWKRFIEVNPQFKDKLSIIAQSLPNDSIPLPIPLKDYKDVNNNKPLKIENEKLIEKEILEYLNKKAGKNYKPTEATLAPISARLNEGYTKEDCLRVINTKVPQWRGDSKMDGFLRPETLFGKQKFPGYANELLPAGQKSTTETAEEPPQQAERVPGDPELENQWDSTLEKIKAQITPELFEKWFEPTYPKFFEDGKLVIAVSNQNTRKCLIENYRDLIEKTLKSVSGEAVLVDFCIESQFAGVPGG